MNDAEQAELKSRDLIRVTGERVTKPRVATLAALLAHGQALSHGELRQMMPDMDRVSLYRSLEWLLAHSLAFRIDVDGQHRYGASAQQHDHRHPHFRCSRCGLTECLSDLPAVNVRLPTGYRLDSVALVLTGQCAACVLQG